jgi:hypothetical protein
MKAQYRKVTSDTFSGATGKVMRQKPLSFVLALYLITHGNADDTGIFAFETNEAPKMGLTEDECKEMITHLELAGFCRYDAATDIIFLPNFTRIQFGEVKEKDSRIISVRRNAKGLPRHEFTEEWVKLYGKLYGVKLDEITEYQYREGTTNARRSSNDVAQQPGKNRPEKQSSAQGVSGYSPDGVPTESPLGPGKVFDPSGYDADGMPIKSAPEITGSNEPEETTQNDSPDIGGTEGGVHPDLGGVDGGLDGVLACESNQIKSNQSKNKQKESGSVGDGVLADATPPPDKQEAVDLNAVLKFLQQVTGYKATGEDLATIVTATGITSEAKLRSRMRGLGTYDPTDPDAAKGFALWAILCMRTPA